MTPLTAQRVGAVLGTALTLLLTLATPAAAHGADAPDATNYRTAITGTPDLPGLEVITIEAGARLQLTNHSGKPVEVLGYNNEPYLEVRPDGVYENIHSPATYLNITIAHVDPPAHADPTVPPEWRKVSDEPVYRWHDQRAIWTDTTEPPAVAAAPGQPHRIREWTVPMRTEVTPLQVTGTLDWVPPPNPVIWWVATVAGALAVALLGLVPGRPRAITVALSVAAIAAGVLALAYAVAREIDAGNHTVGPILLELLTVQLWAVVSALAAIAAGAYSLSRRAAGDFALALGAAAVGLFAGMVNAAVFHRSIAPVPWGDTAARLAVATVIALGVGVAAAGMLRLRGTTSGAPTPTESPTGPDATPHPTESTAL
ncbi:hypothetical protein [Catellatospora citrea]|uniref:Uncharacterized protein n=1 Tax=Catellatospora citrea TaxID=53366 RepID=A0A8J3P2W3_9ACTN|nr:hypothetical protein [Catellatospora citrea]RKE07837.1 hypothetical protein C8E86_2675 [Catellatospora citrea]GIG01938.1 hypothetical protein Cci01nite_70310 [Catellatospora citrea]